MTRIVKVEQFKEITSGDSQVKIFPGSGVGTCYPSDVLEIWLAK